ncbi:MAG: hypothetical protein LQ351_000367 [Letrouitia transgressa]|nr:MAG: hypothetical protein LQ351_000367 [Letrouitia transgressa]
MDRLELSLAELRKELESANAPSEDVAGATAPAQVSSKRLLRVFNKNNRRQALFAAFLMGMMQWSGIDGVLYYAPTLFAQAGLSSTQSSFLASGITGIVILISTIPASLLSDKWGRRASALWGAATLSACMILVGSLYAANQVHNGQGAARWVVIVTIYLFTIAYSVTWSIGFKLYASEIQPAQTRAAASSLAQSANWVCNWIVALITPILLARSSCGAYFLFGSLTLFTGLVCLVYMPESRGRSIDTVHRSFEQSLPERLSAIIRSRWHERKGGNDRGSAACRFDSGVKMSQVSDSGSSQA